MSNRFEVGMLLEAVDEASGAQRRVVLAIVTDIVSVRLLLSLVGCPNTHPGQVVSVDSPEIHPIGWSKSQGRELESPVGMDTIEMNAALMFWIVVLLLRRSGRVAFRFRQICEGTDREGGMGASVAVYICWTGICCFRWVRSLSLVTLRFMPHR